VIAFVADLGGTRIKLGLAEDHCLLAELCLDARSHEGLAPQLPRIATAYRSLCETTGTPPDACHILGMAFPSVIARTNRIAAAYGKYADAPQLDLAAWAIDELGMQLVIENDARLALIGEWKAGAGNDSNDLVMVTLGTGLGTAALVDGRVVRGRHGQAGVLGGHMTVRCGGRLCTCGNRGCAEAEASTSVVAQVARERADYAVSPLRTAQTADYETIFKLARAGDACAQGLRAEAIEIWSTMLVNLIHAYDPERVIVGGGILAGAKDFLPELERRTHAHAHTPWGRVEIVAARLGDGAALLGAAWLCASTSATSP
jgi:glucokinase